MSEELRPIIIKKKKIIIADGHHGGAWKVAYADFVTAMMAFFLLMWLLNATTEEQRKGLADYFSPSIPIASVSGGGAGALSGDSVFTQDDLSSSGTGARGGQGAQGSKANSVDATKDGSDLDANTQNRVNELNAALESSNSGLADHLFIKMSPEGLVIELTDNDVEPLFAVGSTQPSAVMQELIKVVSVAFSDVQNNVKIVGHTDNLSFASDRTYSNWDLSTDRANAARRMLVATGFPNEKIVELSGKAHTDPLSDDPSAPENRRISITILKQS